MGFLPFSLCLKVFPYKKLYIGSVILPRLLIKMLQTCDNVVTSLPQPFDNLGNLLTGNS